MVDTTVVESVKGEYYPEIVRISTIAKRLTSSVSWNGWCSDHFLQMVMAMATLRVINSVLRNFLGTYTSRYSDYEGFWLMGFLVADFGELEFDLLARGGDLNTPLAAAKQLAATKFADQVRKGCLEPARIREARLSIIKRPDLKTGSVNGHPCVGHDVYFRANAVMDNSKRYEKERVLFVAPHDPRVELRSSRYGSS
jgi:hypothetical protein